MYKFLVAFLSFCLLFSDVALAGPSKGYSSSSSSRPSSSSSYSKPSSSSSSYSKPSSSSSYSKPPSSSSGSNKNYSSSTPSTNGSGSTGNKSPPSSSVNSSSKKPTANFQSLPATEQKKAESRTVYQKATTPKETYTTPKGETKKIDANDSKTKQVNETYQKQPEKWVNRTTRTEVFYHNYYSRPIVVYNDPYSSFFWWWMLDQSLEHRAMWAYHHQADMDAARYRDLLAKDAQLEARVRQLEAQKVNRDANYVPPGVEADLQYTDEYCDSVFNPQSKPHDHRESSGGFLHGLWLVVQWIVGIILLVILTCFLWWLVFEKRW